MYTGPLLRSMPLLFTVTPSSVVLLSVSLAVVVILQEQILVAAVYRKSHCRNAQTGECILESLSPTKESCIPPRLAARVSPVVSSLISPE